MPYAKILDGGTNFDWRLQDIDQIVKTVEAMRALGQKIVLTSGTYDIIHIGHANYLEKARSFGDFLVVGVDSDEKVRERKGPNRPIVSQDERLHMLAHLRHVDALVLKGKDDSPHHLMKAIRPDVLVISQTTRHKPENIEDMQKYCEEIQVLEPQAETSTTARIRKLLLNGVGDFAKEAKLKIDVAIDELVQSIQGR